MSWASRRRTLYLSGIFLFIALVVGVPLAIWLYEPANCFDKVQNGKETAIDKGGGCPLLDERTLTPHAILWARAFPVRTAGEETSGIYTAVAYIENPNQNGGVARAPYRFRFYDANNILVGEVEGSTYIMPGTITPVFQGRIETGQRVITRAFFEFTAPLVWERMQDTAGAVIVENKEQSELETSPRVTAHARNGSVRDVKDVSFVAVAFDPGGNAIAASYSTLPLLESGQRVPITFTWPEPFDRPLARIDIIPRLAPAR